MRCLEMGNTGFIWDGIGWSQEFSWSDDDDTPGVKRSIKSYVRRRD